MPSSSNGRSGTVPSEGVSRESGHAGGREIVGGKVYGTIFMGPQSDRETTLERLYTATQRDQWSKQTENDYMERVRARATERVRELLLQARRRGEALENEARGRAEQIIGEAEAVRAEIAREREKVAEEMRQAEAAREQAENRQRTAHETGLAEGRAQAREELVQAREELANATGSVLIGIQEQCAPIFEAWRHDLTALVREVAEKGTGLVIRAERAEVLSSLLDQSMRALLDKRSFSVRVNPEDADLVHDILSDARHVNSRVSAWEVLRDPSLEPGSLVVESESALVDNSRAARFSAVDEVLAHLEIPRSKADLVATETVTQTLLHSLRAVGVDVTEEGEEQGADTSQEDASQNAPSEGLAPEQEEQEILPPLSKDGISLAEVADPLDVMTDEMPEHVGSAQEPPVGDAAEDENFFAPQPESGNDSDTQRDPSLTAPETAPDHGALADTEASELVDAFLGDQSGSDHPLPDIVADELLADMGFAPETKQHSGNQHSAT